MFGFRRSPNPDVLAEPRRLSTADYLCRLMEEQNQLLREVLVGLGRQPQTLKASPAVNGRRKYTAEDVYRVTREDVESLRRAEQEKIEAPWRAGGPGSPQTSPTNGTGLIVTGAGASQEP